MRRDLTTRANALVVKFLMTVKLPAFSLNLNSTHDEELLSRMILGSGVADKPAVLAHSESGTNETSKKGIQIQPNAAKKLPTKKLYNTCLIACWTIITCILLNNFFPATMHTVFLRNQLKDLRDLSVHENFFHVDTNYGGQKETFVSLLDQNVHIYSAIAYNSTKQSVFDSIYLSGWENRMWSKFYQPNFTCCLVYAHHENEIVVTRLLEKHDWYYVGRAKLEVKQYVCPNVIRDRNGHNSRAVAVSLGMDKQCPKNHSRYINIDYPQRQAGNQLAVCAKLMYQNISASTVIEWFEYQRLMGVSKVMVYTNSLNSAAMSVLQYYKSLGFCEHFPFTLPQIADKERGVGVKNFQGWNDEQVPVYDCQGKLSGYTYLGLYDVDEYIHPSEDSNLPKFLSTMREYHPRAAGFTFKTEIYATTWGQDNGTDTVPDLTIGMYTMRTEAYRDRVKSIVITDRLVPGRMSTHGYWAKKPYNKPVVEEGAVTLKHYRTCRKEWLRKNDGEKCYKTIQRVRDTSMLPIAGQIKHKVSEIKNRLGIT